MRHVCLIAMLTLPLLGQPVPPAAPVRLFAGPASGSYMGIGIQEITAERAKELKLRREAGVEVTRVSPESPAEKAGLKAGDVVLQYNGTQVEGIEQLSRLVRETPAGREAKLEISRNGSTQTVSVRISPRPPAPGFPEIFSQRMPDIPRMFSGLRSAMLGVEAEALEGQLAQYFGVSDGVLVRSVMKGSLAEKAGIKAGDVIQRVDDTKVATPGDITGRLRAARGKSVALAIMRDHRETSLTIDVPDPRLGRAEPVRIVSVEE